MIRVLKSLLKFIKMSPEYPNTIPKVNKLYLKSNGYKIERNCVIFLHVGIGYPWSA